MQTAYLQFQSLLLCSYNQNNENFPYSNHESPIKPKDKAIAKVTTICPIYLSFRFKSEADFRLLGVCRGMWKQIRMNHKINQFRYLSGKFPYVFKLFT